MASELAPLSTWLIEPMEPPVTAAIDRLRRAPDVSQVAVMPDVHLASDVCIGTVLATGDSLYPQAVGGDIGCGMLAMGFDASADSLADPAIAGRVLAALGRVIPALRRSRRNAADWPVELDETPLSHPSLAAFARDEGSLQLGTLGSGNHFVELQADEQNRLWLMIHSGSRAMGQAIRDHHLARCEPAGQGLRRLRASSVPGQAYLQDVEWARRFADANRREMSQAVAEVLAEHTGVSPTLPTLISIDHNHVAMEEHGGHPLWVHRKGAMPAGAGVSGLLPGSMGTVSFHVEGRGCSASLCSSAHGAGRAMSRESARRRISSSQLHQQMRGVWFDYRLGPDLREEAPGAYKDLRAVLRAQHELVSVRRTLRPVLNYKGT